MSGWRDQAECRGMDTNLFYPERGEPTKQAKAICAECPVQTPCREDGLHEHFGVWGGTTERERRRMRKALGLVEESTRPARQLQPCGTMGAYQRHIKNHETPCWACREARRESMQAYRDSKRAAS